MSSYFSQLAKQSGLPLAASGKKTSSLTKASKDEKIKPLHREKTVLTSPSVKESNIKKVSSQDNLPKPEQKRTPITDSSKIKSEDKTPQKSSVSEVLETPNRLKTELAQTEILEKLSDQTPQKENLVNESKESKIVREVSRSEMKTSAEKTEEASEKNEISQKTEISQFNPEEEEEKQNKYFAEIGHILEEGSENSPQEVQQIFLREIQQWVADSPALKEESKEAEEDFQQINTIKLSPPEIIETPGLPETIEADSDFSESEPTEQNLSLSIGTISIVIEDSEENIRVAENLTNKNPIQNETAKAERKFSRLSRRYL